MMAHLLGHSVVKMLASEKHLVKVNIACRDRRYCNSNAGHRQAPLTRLALTRMRQTGTSLARKPAAPISND
jgi:hypothetical protein